MSEINEIKSPRALLGSSVLCGAIGFYLAWLGLTQPPSLHVPGWVMIVFSLIWFGVAARMVAQALGIAGSPNWLGFLFCACFGILFASAPFSGHPEDCHSSTSFSFSVFVRTASRDNGTACLREFGAIGWILIAIAIWMAAHWIWTRRGGMGDGG